MKKSHLISLSTAGCLILGGFALTKSRVPSRNDLAGAQNNKGVESMEGLESLGKIRESNVSGTQVGATVRPPAVTADPTASAMGSGTAAELKRFQNLREKVFLSEEEKLKKSQLLHDRVFILSLDGFLKDATVPGTEAYEQQNAALDLLYEAVKSGDATAASDVLQGVVKDSRIENAALSLDQREALGGLKAEVLYNWIALQPRIRGELPGWLPGPASRRILENVLAAHRNNVKESMAIEATR